MNTFDWVKINTSFQFYSKETLKGMARYDTSEGKWSIWKIGFFFLFSLSPFAPSHLVECACRFCPRIYIYIYNRVKMRHGEEGGVSQGRMRGGRMTYP